MSVSPIEPRRTAITTPAAGSEPTQVSPAPAPGHPEEDVFISAEEFHEAENYLAAFMRIKEGDNSPEEDVVDFRTLLT